MKNHIDYFHFEGTMKSPPTVVSPWGILSCYKQSTPGKKTNKIEYPLLRPEKKWQSENTPRKNFKDKISLRKKLSKTKYTPAENPLKKRDLQSQNPPTPTGGIWHTIFQIYTYIRFAISGRWLEVWSFAILDFRNWSFFIIIVAGICHEVCTFIVYSSYDFSIISKNLNFSRKHPGSKVFGTYGINNWSF